MMCRTYAVDGQRAGLPSREMLRQAILEAQSGIGNSGSDSGPAGEAKQASLFAAGSIFAAIAASFCCILPIVFRCNGLLGPWRVGTVRCVATLSAWPDVRSARIGLLLRLSARERAVRTRFRLRYARNESLGTPDVVACGRRSHFVCGVSILLRRCRRTGARQQFLRRRERDSYARAREGDRESKLQDRTIQVARTKASEPRHSLVKLEGRYTCKTSEPEWRH
jgi:hypothetical protein